VPLPAGIQGVHALAAEAREFTLARLSGEVHRLSRTKEYSKWDHVRLLRDALHQLVRPSTGSVNQRARLRSWRDGSE
jgi:hypothetical protein